MSLSNKGAVHLQMPANPPPPLLLPGFLPVSCLIFYLRDLVTIKKRQSYCEKQIQQADLTRVSASTQEGAPPPLESMG